MITVPFRWIIVALFSIGVFASASASSSLAAQTRQPFITPDVSPSIVRSTAVDEPICYLQTANRQTIDLSKLCDHSTGVTSTLQSTYPQPPKVYDQDAVRAFDDSLYGPTN